MILYKECYVCVMCGETVIMDSPIRKFNTEEGGHGSKAGCRKTEYKYSNEPPKVHRCFNGDIGILNFVGFHKHKEVGDITC